MEETSRLVFGKLIWHWLDAALHWLVFFYVIRTGIFFFKNKPLFKTLKFHWYIWIAAALGIVYVVLKDFT
jgi:hypothetical protein